MGVRLYGLFVLADNAQEKVKQINSIYNIPSNKVMEFSVAGSDELLLTYEVEDGNQVSLPASIVLHRNNKFKVMYSINALNCLTSGDKNIKVDWEQYANCLLTTVHKELQVAKIKINKIHNL